VRHPNAFDALYLHPVETFLGLALLIACTWLLGPVHIATFAGVFFVYSALNIIVHCGLDFHFPPFLALSYLARKHDIHHTSMKGGNFASITPIWDILFGTAE
jgi:sterol desaturase/sphingolipid hydroxylase (fatty acid hydroxylase superfamily)